MNASAPLMEPVIKALAQEVPAALLEASGTGESLGWLWQVVGATCCWALSDVICDACIHSPLSGDSATKVSAATQDKEEVRGTAASTKAKEPVVFHPRGGHQPPAPTAASRMTPRARQRAAGGLSRRQAPADKAKALDQSVDPVEKPAEPDAKKELPASTDTQGRLSAEQNALVSGCVALLTVVVAASFFNAPSESEARSGGSTSTKEVLRLAGAAVGGCVHFSAYFLTLRAYSSVSSTVITPLMQLSAVWMLPFSTLAAAMGFASFIRPIHLMSVMLICAGGFLPAAGGCLSDLVSRKFWSQRAVRLVIWGELLVCLYNVILHQATFNAADLHTADTHGTDNVGASSTMRFFLVSRAANGLTCMAMFLLTPSLRSHMLDLRKVNLGYILVAFAGECLSMVGVCLVTFSYSSFYEPSVVNAAEGGLQQLFNLLFALTSRHVLGCGREVEQLSVKLVSFGLVAVGLAMSTL